MAWAAPAIVGVSALPAFAASAPPGLQGWVTVRKNCAYYSPTQTQILVTIDGQGTRYPNGIYGLYVHNVTSPTSITAASITFYLPNAIGDATWTREGNDQGWSTPALVSSDQSGYKAYVTTYTGTWTSYPASGGRPAYTIATGVPRFEGSALIPRSNGYCGPDGLTVRAKRCVTVNGNNICFSRSVNL